MFCLCNAWWEDFPTSFIHSDSENSLSLSVLVYHWVNHDSRASSVGQLSKTRLCAQHFFYISVHCTLINLKQDGHPVTILIHSTEATDSPASTVAGFLTSPPSKWKCWRLCIRLGRTPLTHFSKRLFIYPSFYHFI